MTTSCFPSSFSSISNLNLQTVELFVPSNLDEPIIISFSPSIVFKISRSQKSSCTAVAEILTRNGTPLYIKSIYQMMFLKQFSCICNAKLIQLGWNSTQTLNFPQNSTEKIEYRSENQQIYLQTNLLIQNNLIKIEFYQTHSSIELIAFNSKDLIQKILIFLKHIDGPLNLQFQKIGTLKPSFSEKYKNSLQIEKSKKTIKSILKQQKSNEVQSTLESISLETEQPSRGVFECLNVIRQEEINEEEFIFKRGGYFNIQKRKLVVAKSTNQMSSLQSRVFAEKKLSKRKRPNTIYNYEGKIPRQLKLLECLNKASLEELNHFARYYILNESTRVDHSSEQMIDENDSISKETLSTVSQQRPLGQTINDVIYMDFYDENLEEYLARKGKLDAFEIISLLKQILQSVLILHKVGIVHRDIKPANFMIETLNDGAVKTKLIDFGESTHVSFNFDNSEILGFSTQYAPIECTYSCKEGFNSRKIDLWSVGVVVYKLTTNRMPVTYSKCFKSDIKFEWPTSLNFFTSQYGKGRWSIIQNMLLFTALSFMRVNPVERLDLKRGLNILEQIEIIANELVGQQNFHIQ